MSDDILNSILDADFYLRYIHADTPSKKIEVLLSFIWSKDQYFNSNADILTIVNNILALTKTPDRIMMYMDDISLNILKLKEKSKALKSEYKENLMVVLTRVLDLL